MVYFREDLTQWQPTVSQKKNQVRSSVDFLVTLFFSAVVRNSVKPHRILIGGKCSAEIYAARSGFGGGGERVQLAEHRARRKNKNAANTTTKTTLSTNFRAKSKINSEAL